MTINHIDQLAQWWRDAEEGIGKAGDVVIERDDSPNFETASYVVFTLGRDEHENLTYRRVLARAPKPKPAWHDADAVIAHADYCERQVWQRDTNYESWWYGTAGDGAATSDLRDVTPLIEAKVTDEMVERARHRADAMAAAFIYSASEWHMREVLTAALGLETK